PAIVVRAPGRVNLIGEHTDYNEGFVLPMAIEQSLWIALSPRDDEMVMVYSMAYEESATFSLSNLLKEELHWYEYLKGTAWSLAEAGYSLAGWQGVLMGEVPVGAGLSSSAALEMATARAFTALTGDPWRPAQMAQVGQRTENHWIGVQSGIM